MDERLKCSADALWSDVMSKAGMLERRALNAKRDLFYGLIKKHFGPAYTELAAVKGEQVQ
jgi:hypothetical protein